MYVHVHALYLGVHAREGGGRRSILFMPICRKNRVFIYTQCLPLAGTGCKWKQPLAGIPTCLPPTGFKNNLTRSVILTTPGFSPSSILEILSPGYVSHNTSMLASAKTT